MHRYFATCARGLEPLLARELQQLRMASVEPGRGGVHFSGDAAAVYRASLWLRTAVRILRPLLQQPVRCADDLYDAVRSLDWRDYLTPDRTLAVDCNVRDSEITHSQFAARRVKDAICDQFRERMGVRPSVDVEKPAVGLNLHVSRDVMTLSLDASWHSLHKRGYRPIQTRAPLNEALAAGLLLQLGYDGSESLADPLCGSGTFLVEGAWIAMNRAPGLTRPWFGFQGWSDFQPALWSAARDQARHAMRPAPACPVVGSDVRRDAVEFARANANAAGLGPKVGLAIQDVFVARPPDGPPGLIVCNPPYGERLSEERELISLYATIGEVTQRHWPEWRLAIFTSNDFLARMVGRKVKRQLPFFNGGLPCKLWEYDRT